MNKVYVVFVRRWWWLVLIGALIAIGVVNNSVRKQQPLYRSQATVQVGRATQDKNPDQNELTIIDRLVPTYAELAVRDPILIATVESLRLPFGPADLRARMLVMPVRYVPLIDIAVVDTDPVRAAAIANEVARQMVLQSPAESKQDAGTQEFIQNQLNDLRVKISQGQAEVAKLQNQISTLTSATDIQEAQRRLAAVQEQIDSWQGSYARLVAAAEPSRTNLVTIVSPAMPALAPLSARNTLNYALALVIGAGLAVLLALALEVANRAITSPDELGALTDEVPIVTIPRYRTHPRSTPVLATQPGSAAAAAYRRLRNTIYAKNPPPGTTIAVTSCRVAEGKTTTAANLALAMAHAGRSTILVDTNVRNPELDRNFGLAPAPGFSDLVLGRCTLDQALQPSDREFLRILTAGTIPENYEDLLGLNLVSATIAALSRAAEVIVFDTGAIGEEQDTLLLTKHMDSVLLVAEAGRIQGPQLQEALDMLGHADAQVVAVALNKVQVPRFSLDRLPWSREARNRAHAKQSRLAHGWARSGQKELQVPGD